MRFHLFELEDFAWYPNVIRENQTDYLRFLMELFDVFKAVIPVFEQAVQQTKPDQIVDLCSGGGGSMMIFRKYLKTLHQKPFKAILTDLYPNLKTFEFLRKESHNEIDFVAESVNAINPPSNLKGFYTLFNSFHHFKPAQAKEILQNAVKNNAPIAIFEPMEKSVLQILINCLALTLLMWLATPFIRPFRWSRYFFTYLIPLIPFCTWFDGMVSVLRLYTPKEMLAIANSLESSSYVWKAGVAKHTFGRVTYLIGYPK